MDSIDLGETTFPLLAVDLQRFSTDYSVNADSVKRFVVSSQKDLETLASSLETAKNPRFNEDAEEEDDEEDAAAEDRRRVREKTLDDTLNCLYSVYQDLIDIKEKCRVLNDAQKTTAQTYVFPPEFDNIKDHNIDKLRTRNFCYTLDENYEQGLRRYLQTPKYKRYGEDGEYAALRQSIWEVYHEGQVPNISREFSDYEESDDEMVVEETRESYKCPLTKQYFEEPVTSKVCHHSFTRTAIESVFDGSYNGLILCPVPSCSHHFQRRDLVPNSALEKRTKRAMRKDQRDHEQTYLGVDTL